jgi:hypothetical protein
MSTIVGDFGSYSAANSGVFQPVLEITLTNTPGSGDWWGDDPPPWFVGNVLNVSGGVTFARDKAYNPIVTEWGDIPRGFDVRASDLQPLELEVTLADPDGSVQAALELAQQRGSAAAIYYVLPGNATDYQLLFTGILERWGYRSGGLTILTLRTDDSILRTYLP